MNVVSALSAFNAGPVAALANGAKPTTRKADIRMAKRRRISFDSFLELPTRGHVVTHLS